MLLEHVGWRKAEEGGAVELCIQAVRSPFRRRENERPFGIQGPHRVPFKTLLRPTTGPRLDRVERGADSRLEASTVVPSNLPFIGVFFFFLETLSTIRPVSSV